LVSVVINSIIYSFELATVLHIAHNLNRLLFLQMGTLGTIPAGNMPQTRRHDPSKTIYEAQIAANTHSQNIVRMVPLVSHFEYCSIARAACSNTDALNGMNTFS
jgi:hypothetical protein